MTTLQCSYCSLTIDDDSYLHCGQCGGDVHVKCLRHASTPGDLFGDVFFDFTCAKCMQIHYDRPSTSSECTAGGAREKFVRQRMPWLLVITLALYNLSIKSKGLSRHGYFHWRTHIVNFIDKNWDYLFDPSIKRRKKWTGSISGALSHNSPTYFTSGQEQFEETGWWKLTYANKTPKYVFNIYEQQCIKRQQVRNDKRLMEDSYTSDNSNPEQDTKRIKQIDTDDELIVKYHCSRMIPYMGRKPKIAKQLDVLEDDHLQNKPTQKSLETLDETSMSLNTVQSSLMDFLAESLASDDLTMFNTLPNIAPEPLVESCGKNDLLPLLDAPNDNANAHENTTSFIKAEPMDLNGHLYSDLNTQLMFNEKLKSFYVNKPLIANDQPYGTYSPSVSSFTNRRCGIGKNLTDDNQIIAEHDYYPEPTEEYCSHDPEDENTTTSTLLRQPMYEDDDDAQQQFPESEESDCEEFQPRIVQVTNFQQIPPKKRRKHSESSPVNSGKVGKHERKVEIDNEQNEQHSKAADDEEEEDYDVSSGDDSDVRSLLKDCKQSLFTKQPRRKLPWLVEVPPENGEVTTFLIDDELDANIQRDLTMMSEYEEKVLMQKLRRIFSLEGNCNTPIPSSVRRMYRKLCIREWKRKHGKPLFNLDDYINGRCVPNAEEDITRIIDRYQLISLSSKDSKRSFYARIVGSFQCEFFESPYTQRILHPYIFRNRKCFPPFLKIMCELQYKVNGTYPTRAPIDFCYVRPNHIAAVNSLLESEFWPGIDMSECLSYPDYSIVALYKKLVIGCGFLVPDVGFNDAYISFMAVRPGWQRAGLGTFMLYHLIQTCMTKDITLHVSATNPAVVLYQKFGFKMEEVILNFYDKYLPFESKHSRHALFLRLMR